MWWKIAIGAGVGLVLGLLAGRTGRCSTGACPLTASPLLGAISGLLLGGLVAYVFVAPQRPGTAVEAAAGRIEAVESAEQFDRALAEAKTPVVVDFYADWCPSCRKLAPRLESLAEDYAGRAEFLKVDTDKLKDLSRKHDIQYLPTVIVFQGGREVHRWVGLNPVDKYRSYLDTLTKEKPMTQPARTVTMKGQPLELIGELPKLHRPAPQFEVVGNDLSPVKLADFAGKIIVISAVPSLDTEVCDLQTRRFNEAAGRLGDDVVVLTISMDLPFAQKRWCGAAGVEHVKTLSDHRDAAFGRAYGVLIEQLRLLARAVFAVDRRGTIRYIQLVDELTNEPDYDAALAVVKELADS